MQLSQGVRVHACVCVRVLGWYARVCAPLEGVKEPTWRRKAHGKNIRNSEVLHLAQLGSNI